MTKREARRIVYRAIVATLDNDLDGTGAAWIYECDEKNADKIERAAREVLRSLRRFA